MNLKHYLNRQRNDIDAALQRYIDRKCPSRHLHEPLQYALMAGGKRLRPVLCLAAADAVGGSMADAMPAACALEMIHTYSLIHDDLPAMDDDDLRRGQATCHIKFGEGTAILSGDTLLNLAFEVLGEAGLEASAHLARVWLRVIDTIGHAAGCNGMIEGQARDIANEGIPLGRDDLQSLHELKTGALIRASVLSGGTIGRGAENQMDQLDVYSRNIGLAFQVVDDILNITGDPEKMGKAVGTDAQRQKNTYPALMGLEASGQFAVDLIDSALQALSIFDTKADPLREIARYIVARNR
jgi:geranylgeranyl diphosphate synthase, type II